MKWVKYVQGQSKKPKMTYAEAAITGGSPKTKNKPLVAAKIEGVKQNLFIDTGAELNVIDAGLVKKILRKNNAVKLMDDSSMVRCANDSRMKTMGKVEVLVDINGVCEKQIFSIVPKIFPRVILGIRQMKKSNIQVDPTLNCIWLDGMQVPLVSKISNPTVLPEN